MPSVVPHGGERGGWSSVNWFTGWTQMVCPIQEDLPTRLFSSHSSTAALIRYTGSLPPQVDCRMLPTCLSRDLGLPEARYRVALLTADAIGSSLIGDAQWKRSAAKVRCCQGGQIEVRKCSIHTMISMALSFWRDKACSPVELAGLGYSGNGDQQTRPNGSW